MATTPNTGAPRKSLMPKESKFGAWPVAVAALAVLLVGLVIAGLLTSGDDTATIPDSPSAAEQSTALDNPLLAGVKTYDVSSNHVEGTVDYDVTPPAGGDHSPVWLNCGVYDFQVPSENAVHAMEHGAVWITYDPAQVSADDLTALENQVNLTYEILSPYPGLPAPVVASAWGKQLHLTGADDPALPVFIQAFRQGPQTPEPGAPCTGGTDGKGSTGTSMSK